MELQSVDVVPCLRKLAATKSSTRAQHVSAPLSSWSPMQPVRDRVSAEAQQKTRGVETEWVALGWVVWG